MRMLTATPQAETHAALDDLLEGRRPGRCFVIAEIGVNHDGRLDRALELLNAARDSGANAVKIQLFTPSELCSGRDRPDEMAMLEGLRLDDAAQREVCHAAREMALPLIATPFDSPSMDLLRELDIPIIKIGSGEVTHTPHLAAIARSGKPVILSTGGCELTDADRAVATLQEHGCARLSVLHCVSAYPPPDDEANLRVITTLQQRYPALPIGYSDHTLGIAAPLAAVALGACLIEKHLTLDTHAAGPDHAASADPATFAAMVREIRRVEAMLGDGRKRLMPCEGKIGRSIVAARDLPAGHTLTPADLAFKRPGDGLRPHAADQLIGRRLSRPVAADEQIHAADFTDG